MLIKVVAGDGGTRTPGFRVLGDSTVVHINKVQLRATAIGSYLRTYLRWYLLPHCAKSRIRTLDLTAGRALRAPDPSLRENPHRDYCRIINALGLLWNGLRFLNDSGFQKDAH